MSFVFEGPGRDAETTRQPVKVNARWDRLTREAITAGNEGKTYGKWKAEQWEKERQTRERLERERMERARLRAEKNQERREAQPAEERGMLAEVPEWKRALMKPKEKKYGQQCGKEVEGKNRKFCDDECKALFHEEKRKAINKAAMQRFREKKKAEGKA